MKKVLFTLVMAMLALPAFAQYSQQENQTASFLKPHSEGFKIISFTKVTDITAGDLIDEKYDFFEKMIQSDLELLSMGGLYSCPPSDRYDDDFGKMMAFLELQDKYISEINNVIYSLFNLKYEYIEGGKTMTAENEVYYSPAGKLLKLRFPGQSWITIDRSAAVPKIEQDIRNVLMTKY